MTRGSIYIHLSCRYGIKQSTRDLGATHVPTSSCVRYPNRRRQRQPRDLARTIKVESQGKKVGPYFCLAVVVATAPIWAAVGVPSVVTVPLATSPAVVIQLTIMFIFTRVFESISVSIFRPCKRMFETDLDLSFNRRLSLFIVVPIEVKVFSFILGSKVSLGIPTWLEHDFCFGFAKGSRGGRDEGGKGN